MKIGQPINELSARRIREVINNHKKYTDFNRLGLFRGLIESERISAEERTELQQLTIATFDRYFDFLVIKDSETWWRTLYPNWMASNLSDRLDKRRHISELQEAIIKSKRFGHRNFGNYSKHDCGYDDCSLKGVMVKKHDRRRYDGQMCFASDPQSRKYGRWYDNDYKRRGKHRNQVIRDWEAEE